jgi:hypothetical protein
MSEQDKGSEASRSQSCADASALALAAADRGNFSCVICRYSVDMRWNHLRGPGQIVPPICMNCERSYSHGVGKPKVGTFRDRRNVMRGVALAEALHSEAARQTWKARYV